MVDWNDIELVDGRFYIIEITPWGDGHENNWIYSFRSNLHDDWTLCYVSSYFGSDAISQITSSHTYAGGRVCSNSDIRSIREATYDEVRAYIKALGNIGMFYNLNTRKINGARNR